MSSSDVVQDDRSLASIMEEMGITREYLVRHLKEACDQEEDDAAKMRAISALVAMRDQADREIAEHGASGRENLTPQIVAERLTMLIERLTRIGCRLPAADRFVRGAE